MFYWAVVQVVLLFGAETWVLLATISRKLEGVHVGILRNITGQREKKQRGGTWRNEAAAKVLKEAGTHSLGAYIDKRQASMAEWVALRPILEICGKGNGYEGGGRRQELWWRQKADRNQLSATLDFFLRKQGCDVGIPAGMVRAGGTGK